MSFDINDIHEEIQKILSITKTCPKCELRFKDSSNKMIYCIACNRENKINQLIND
jgi:hypothetical protein